jgi:hypothetical protein
MTAYSKILGSVRDTQGVAQGARAVTVYLTGTETLASLFLDDDSTPMPNPFTSNFDGSYAFNVAAGSYDIAVQVDPYTILTQTNVPAAPTSVSGGAVTAVTGTSPVVSSGGTTPAISVPVFVASGGGHEAGLVPDPGSTSGTTKYLREDASWDVPGSSAGVSSLNTLTGALTLAAGTNITLTPSGSTVTIAASGGGGGGGAQLLTSVLDQAAAAIQPGPITCGLRFMPAVAGLSCTGIQVYWLGAATSLAISLWDHTGTKVNSATLVVTATPGIFSVNFGSPTALSPGLLYTISYSDTAVSPQLSDAPTTLVPVNVFTPPGVLLGNGGFVFWYNTAVDTYPNTGASSGLLLDPLF